MSNYEIKYSYNNQQTVQGGFTIEAARQFAKQCAKFAGRVEVIQAGRTVEVYQADEETGAVALVASSNGETTKQARMNKATKVAILEAAQKVHYGVKFNNKAQTFKVCYSFYYRNGMTTDKLAADFKAVYPNVEEVGHGENYVAFNGGAKQYSKQDTYMWVEFKLAGPDAVK